MQELLRTVRLRLRELEIEDAEALWHLDSDPEVLRFVGASPATDVEAYRARIVHVFRPAYADPAGGGCFAAEELATNRFVGWVFLRPGAGYRFAEAADFQPGDYEIGYRFLRDVWGQGYATESASALVEYGWRHYPTQRLVAVVVPEHRASRKVLEKLGLQHDGEFLEPGSNRVIARYVLTRFDRTNVSEKGPMECVIRAPTIIDMETIVEYNIRMAMETENKALDRATVTAGVQGMLAQPSRGRYYLAANQDGVLGQLMLTYEWSDWRNGDIWWIQSVYVHPDHRQRGIYRALHQHVRTQAQQTPGVVGLRLYVEFHNQRAVSVYERQGMVDAHYRVMEEIFSPSVPR